MNPPRNVKYQQIKNPSIGQEVRSFVFEIVCTVISKL